MSVVAPLSCFVAVLGLTGVGRGWGVYALVAPVEENGRYSAGTGLGVGGGRGGLDEVTDAAEDCLRHLAGGEEGLEGDGVLCDGGAVGDGGAFEAVGELFAVDGPICVETVVGDGGGHIAWDGLDLVWHAPPVVAQGFDD